MARLPDRIAYMDETELSFWGCFFIGGEYEKTEDPRIERVTGQMEAHRMCGQAYVEVYVPDKITRPYPLVFLPGNNQTMLSWMGTPDGRKGWAQYFWEQGYLVYLVDVQHRGRAVNMVREDQKKFIFSAEKCERVFAGKDNLECTQWFGKPERGDESFDTFYATITPSLNDNRQMQSYMQKAGAELLDKIGPAILITHSQAGPYAWLIADARPGMVKGMVQLEPKGPPFHDDRKRRNENAVWGLTEIPLHYEPPIKSGTELVRAEVKPEDPFLDSGYLQEEPARRLPNLADVPIMIISGGASKHARYDYLTAAYLRQAGVKEVCYVSLREQGIMGNSHMIMLEKNNLTIAEMALKWIEQAVETEAEI